MSSPPSSVSKALATTVTFTPAVGTGETVGARIRDSTGSAQASGSTDINGATTVTIAATDLATLTSGAGELVVERRKSSNLIQATTVGGAFSVEYKTAKQSITITN